MLTDLLVNVSKRTLSKFSLEQLKTSMFLTAFEDTRICGRRIPPGTYQIKEPLNLSSSEWFDILLRCRI